MPQSFRPLLITTAALALIECAAIGGGCASKPRPPELTVATATAPSKPTSSTDPLGAAAGSGTGGGGSAVPSLRGQTSQERQAALDKRLNDSLGAFDAKLRSEQQKLAQERDARQATVATVAAADNNSEGSDSHRKRGQTRSAAYAGDLKSDKSGAGAAATAGNGAVANEIPDGSDDDIIARRLRKAAE